MSSSADYAGHDDEGCDDDEYELPYWLYVLIVTDCLIPCAVSLCLMREAKNDPYCLWRVADDDLSELRTVVD